MFHYASNDSVYKGEWKADQKNGIGKQTWTNGAWYDGNWKDNFKEGEGVIVFEDGNKYVGPWKKDKMNGIFKVTKQGITETIEYQDHKFKRRIQ